MALTWSIRGGPRYVTRRVGAAELAMVGASEVLAVHGAVIGGTVRLLAEPPSAVPQAVSESWTGPVVSGVNVIGPLAQRAHLDLACAYVDGYDAVTARFEAALSSDADAVVMVIDSPGGDAAGLAEAVDRMRAARDASGKPVVAYVDEVAASAAYWIAAGVADEIVVPATGRVGSVGCIGAYVDESGAWRQQGVEWHVVREPAGKAEMMPAAPLNELAERRLRERVSEIAGVFVDAVAGYRKMKPRRVRAQDAALFSGQAAVDEGLADRVGTLEAATARASELATERRERKRDMGVAKLVAASLGLPEGASEAAIVEAYQARASLVERVIERAGVPLGAIAGELDALRLQAEQVEPLTAKVAQLESAVAASHAATEAAEVAQLADKLSAEGKLAPTRRAAFVASAREHGVGWARATAEILQPVAAGAEPPKLPVAAPEGDADVSERERGMCAALGVKVEDYAAAKRAARKAA